MTGSRQRWIWWILLVAALPRLVNIGAQPVGHHGWRQADTAAVARNFQHGGHRLLFPEVDWETPGWVEMELPLYPWVVSLGYAVAGERIWLARGAAVAASLLTIYVLFLLVHRFVGREEARWAALLWALLPLTIFFGRAVMPEAWMIAASVAGVWSFARWRETAGWRPLLSAAFFVGLAGSLKLTSLHLGLPLLWLAGNPARTSPRARRQLAVFAAAVAAPIALWYAHAYRLGAETGATFGIFSGSASKVGQWDLLLAPHFYSRVFVDFFADRLLTWVGLVLFLFGLFLPRRSAAERLFDWWLAGAAIVLLLACGGSYYHEYYALPMVVPAVVHMGRALAWMHRRSLAALATAIAALALFSVVRVISYLDLEATPPRDPAIVQDRRVGRLLSQYTSAASLVVSCDRTDPTWLFLSRRRGWGRDCAIMDKRALGVLHGLGARFLIARHEDFETGPTAARLRRLLLSGYQVVHDDGEVFLVDLEPVPLSQLASRPLLSETFDTTVPPPDWLLETGRWRREGEMLTIEPTRRQLDVVIGSTSTACNLCGLRVTLAVEPVGAPDRRSVLTLRGWQTASGHTDAAFDLTSRRLTMTRVEAGSIVASASGMLPDPLPETLDLELDCDPFECRAFLRSDLLLALPVPAASAPGGGFGLSARNLRLRLREVTILEATG